MAGESLQPEPEKLHAAAGMLQDLYASALIAGTVGLGLKLNLYETLSQIVPCSSDELAQAGDCNERWVREWLRSQATAGILDYVADDQFTISPEMVRLLVEDERIDSMRQPFSSLFYKIRALERLQESFHSGLGRTWDDNGEDAVESSDQSPRNVWYRVSFVPDVLPLFPGLGSKLAMGGKVADIGCGTGGTLIAMGRAFPQAVFHGYEVSRLSLERAEANGHASGVTNVFFHDARTQPIPADSSYDLVLTVDALHDMTHPEEAARAVFAALKPDGVWFIEDMNAAPNFEEQLQRDGRRAAPLYALSLAICLSSSLSEPGGAGLGTLGLPEAAIREMVTAAGFSQFRRLDLGRPQAAYYEVRR